MKVVSLITARGGSKSVPSKNIIDVNGKPLIWYSIKASLDSNISETWVSTDSKKIATLSEAYGARVLNRPKELSTDTSKSDDTLMHFASKVDFDILVFIQPTSPFINSNYINIGLQKIKTYDSVFTVTKEHWLPRWDMEINPIDWETSKRPMRKDKPTVYVEAGMFYITTRKGLLLSKLRYSGKIGVVEIPLSDSLQIDSLDDLEVIQKLMKSK